jgi:hypothetical protein
MMMLGRSGSDDPAVLKCGVLEGSTNGYSYRRNVSNCQGFTDRAYSYITGTNTSPIHNFILI